MTKNHYPDIERCKKLTEIGFPATENIMQVNKKWDSRIISQELLKELSEYESEYCLDKIDNLEHHKFWWFSEYMSGHEWVYKFHSESDVYVCPSVMDMLDVIPFSLTNSYCNSLMINKLRGWFWYDIYYSANKPNDVVSDWPLPNGLADLIMWLHKNNYIKF